MPGRTRGAAAAEVFKGDCLPAFRVEYLPAGAIPHCIDFILASEAIKAEGTTLLFTEKVALPGGPGYASDHWRPRGGRAGWMRKSGAAASLHAASSVGGSFLLRITN